MPEHVHTIVLGAGQSGLGTSYCLTQRGIEHVILERASRPGHVWSDERWDSFSLVVPNWGMRLPGGEYHGPDPDGFMPRDEIARYFENYARQIKAPVRYNTTVESIEPDPAGKGFLVRTNDKTYQSGNVVMANGTYQKAKLPPFAADMPASVTQMLATDYRSPQALPSGAVLVVGSGQSGAQIAEELYQKGRTVYLSVSSAGRLPRRYRGRDSVRWVDLSGFFNRTADQFPIPRSRLGSFHVSGRDGGHDLNLHVFAHDGVMLLGHLRGVQDSRLLLAADLYEDLAKADATEVMITKAFDGYIERNGIDAPVEVRPVRRDGFSVPLLTDLDVQAAGISSVIWATGFRYDLGPLRLPLLDSEGYPIQQGGVSAYPGVYFAGMPWMPTLNTGFQMGMARQVNGVADHIAARPA